MGSFSSSSLLEMVGNEGNGILADEVYFFSGEARIEANGLNGISAKGILRIDVPIRAIGRVSSGSGAVLSDSRNERDIASLGHDHFRTSR